MKIYTNANNTSTLKLLIAANFACKSVDVIKYVEFEELKFDGPRCLPILVVDEELSFFSSNTAVQYLFPVIDLTESSLCQQLQEWEATRLQPAVAALANSKTPAPDLKQALQGMLQSLDFILSTQKYILGSKLSGVDVTIWSTMYPLFYNNELKQYFMEQVKHITRWMEHVADVPQVKSAVRQWNGSAIGPFGVTSALGTAQLASLIPTGSPDEGAETGPTPEEIEAAKDLWANGLSYLQPKLTQEKIVLPVKGRKNVLITSALPYVNNVPHLGNIIGCVLSADIFARYCRICDYNTLFVCGTDEYGTATETKALEEKITPKEICDKYFAIHNSVYRWFNIGFDYFGRTSTPEQTKIAQKLFLKLNENGFVTSQSVDQLLCENCDRFLADRFVEGTCPHPGCGYESARGDQCDKCGKLINAIELIEPRCKQCEHKPTVRPSEQLFLELGQLEPALRTWISGAESGWSAPARAVTRAWLRDALRARAVTRDLKWGVTVPLPGYTNKVFYVWFDAPIGYLSITECLTKQHEAWWKPDKEYDVKLYQFMAKDNVPFHVIMFPATILGVNEGYHLVDHIFATEYLNYEEGKFSKSRGVGVFGTDAQETGIPSDVWRFYLASIRPETSDSSFSWVELGTRNNSELLNNLGNFCHRSLTFCSNNFKGVVPNVNLIQEDYELIALVNRDVIAYVQEMERGRLRESLRHVLRIARRGNQLMQSQQPWLKLKGDDTDKERGATVIGLCCQLVALLAALLEPYLPDSARRLRTQLQLSPDSLRLNPLKPGLMRYLPEGHVIEKPFPLFAKLDPEQLEMLKAKYSGTQAERAQQDTADVPRQLTVLEIEAAIKAQADRVRRLKDSRTEKLCWHAEVKLLGTLKDQLAVAQAAEALAAEAKAATLEAAEPKAASATALTGPDVASLEKAIAEQGDKLRKLKATTKDKAILQPEINNLLNLKKQLVALQNSQ